MKTASVRDLRQDFPRILAWLHAGEEVAITLRRQPIATLTPRRARKGTRPPRPDLARRLRKVFGERILPDQAVKKVLDETRGSY